MRQIASFDPAETFAAATPFVQQFGPEGATTIDPLETPLTYAEMMADLNPRRLSRAEQMAAIASGGEPRDLIRYQLAEKRKNWGKGHEEVVQTVADAMQLTLPEVPFEAQPDGSATVFSHITAIEGANDQDYLRAAYAVTAHEAGLIVVKTLVANGSNRTAGKGEKANDQETTGLRGFDIVYDAVARVRAERPNLCGLGGGEIDLHAIKTRTRSADTRQVLREAWLGQNPDELAAGNIGISTSAKYTTFMGHDAATVGLELGMPLENMYIVGLPSPAGTKVNNATIGAEICQAAVSAAYHQHVLNTKHS